MSFPKDSWMVFLCPSLGLSIVCSGWGQSACREDRFPCCILIGESVDEQQPLFPGKAHCSDLTNIYLSFSLPLPPLSVLFFLLFPLAWILLPATQLPQNCSWLTLWSFHFHDDYISSLEHYFLFCNMTFCTVFLLSPTMPFAIGVFPNNTDVQASLAHLSAFGISLTGCIVQSYMIYC